MDLSQDEDASPIYSKELSYKSRSQVLFDRVLTKAVSEYSHFKPVVNERLCSLTTAKLWRMGKLVARMNSRQRKQMERLEKFTWKLLIQTTEIKFRLMQQKENLQRKLEQESTQKRALEQRLSSTTVTVQVLPRAMCSASASTKQPIEGNREIVIGKKKGKEMLVRLFLKI